MIRVGDTVEIKGRTSDCYKVESISAKGIAKLHWECGQYESAHISMLSKPKNVYVGSNKYKVSGNEWTRL